MFSSPLGMITPRPGQNLSPELRIHKPLVLSQLENRVSFSLQ